MTRLKIVKKGVKALLGKECVEWRKFKEYLGGDNAKEVDKKKLDKRIDTSYKLERF